MNSEDDILYFTSENFKKPYVLVFDLTSMQDFTENCHYPEVCGEPLRLKLEHIVFPLEHITELLVLEKQMCSVAVDKFGVVRRNV